MLNHFTLPNTILLIYAVCISLTAFLMMGIDKRKARLHQWRIPERMLFLPAILGGSPGAILGMLVFHHKTKHPKFVIGMPLILAAEGALLLWLMREGGLLPR